MTKYGANVDPCFHQRVLFFSPIGLICDDETRENRNRINRPLRTRIATNKFDIAVNIIVVPLCGRWRERERTNEILIEKKAMEKNRNLNVGVCVCIENKE